MVRPAEPDFPAVIGRLKGSEGKPALGMTQLYNTVYIGDRSLWSVDPLGAEIKDGRIWGRGATNSKGSVAAMIESARVLKESGVALKGDLILLFIPGEGGTEFCLPWVVEKPSRAHPGRLVSGRGRQRQHRESGPVVTPG